MSQFLVGEMCRHTWQPNPEVEVSKLVPPAQLAARCQTLRPVSPDFTLHTASFYPRALSDCLPGNDVSTNTLLYVVSFILL